jgi:hypothetical protein
VDEVWTPTVPVDRNPEYDDVEVTSVVSPAVGDERLDVVGWYQPELQSLIGTRVAISTEIGETLATYVVDTMAHKNYRVRHLDPRFVSSGYLTFPRQGLRMRPGLTATAEVLMLFGRPVGIAGPPDEEAMLVRWAPEAPGGSALAFAEELPPAPNRLHFATPRAALVGDARLEDGTPASLLIDLTQNQVTSFRERDLAAEYVLLGPEFLLNLDDTQFHTPDLTLTRTVLPVPLAPSAPTPAPDAAYHLIGLP